MTVNCDDTRACARSVSEVNDRRHAMSWHALTLLAAAGGVCSSARSGTQRERLPRVTHSQLSSTRSCPLAADVGSVRCAVLYSSEAEDRGLSRRSAAAGHQLL